MAKSKEHFRRFSLSSLSGVCKKHPRSKNTTPRWLAQCWGKIDVSLDESATSFKAQGFSENEECFYLASREEHKEIRGRKIL